MIARCSVCWPTVHYLHQLQTDSITTPHHLFNNDMPQSQKRLNPNSTQRAPSGRGTGRRKTGSMTTTRKPASNTPQRRLNFDNLDTFSAGKFSMSSAEEKKLDVKVYIISCHLAIVIPGYGTDGWIDNLANGIVLPKSIGMTGFKLAAGIAGGENRFGFYKFFENAEDTMTELFDETNQDTFNDGTKIGKADPNADPPKVRHFLWSYAY